MPGHPGNGYEYSSRYVRTVISLGGFMGEFDLDRVLLKMEAGYRSNNWRKMHGFPLRRGVVNKQHKKMKEDLQKHVFVLGRPGMGKARYFIQPHL